MINLRRGRPRRLVLDIGASAVRLCELSLTKSGLQLTKFYQRELLNDPAVDEETKKKQRREAIKALMKEAKVRNRKTILCVPGRSVFTRTRTLPPVPQYKVTQIVRYEIQQQIPFALDQIALDYQILNRTDAGSYDVMMAAIKVDVVDKHLEVLKETKCRIDSVDVSPIAAYNWLKFTGDFGTDGECVALLDIGASTTDIVIERGNQFRFTRPLNIGGDDITRAISTKFGVNFEDAEKAKRQRGFAPTGDPKVDGPLGECIGQVLTRMVGEITRSFGYFRSLPGGGTIDRVVVTGGGARMRNFIPFLQRSLSIEVRPAQTLKGIEVGPGAQAVNECPEQAAVALGMALRACQPATIEINLIPPQIIQAARRREQAFYWVLSLITLGFIAASIIPSGANKDRQVREDIKKITLALESYVPELVRNPGPDSEPERELKRKQDEVAKYQRQLELLRNACTARNWLDDLKILNDLRPEGGRIWYSSIETSVITPAPPPANNQQNKSGVTSTGFSGIGSTRTIAARESGNRRNQAPAAPTTAAPPVPNGYRVMGYAKDPDSLTLFINRLRENERFRAPAGAVYFNEASVEPVHISELNNARVSQRGMSGGGDAARSGAVGGGGGNRAAGGSVLEQYPPAEIVYFFSVDLQYEQPQAPQQPDPGAQRPRRQAPPAPPREKAE